MTDKEMLLLLEKSPKEAHLAIITEYGNLVYAVVRNRLRGSAGHEEIKDCVSDVFLEIFRSIDKFSESKGSLKNFVSTIAKNMSLNAFRRVCSNRIRAVSIDDEKSEVLLSHENTEQEVQKKIFSDRLWDIVNSLGEPDTSIIIYQYFYEFKVHEIAKKLSMTSAAVQKRSIRARKRIKKMIEAEGGAFHE